MRRRQEEGMADAPHTSSSHSNPHIEYVSSFNRFCMELKHKFLSKEARVSVLAFFVQFVAVNYT